MQGADGDGLDEDAGVGPREAEVAYQPTMAVSGWKTAQANQNVST